MSALLKEILDDLRAKRIEYAEFLRRMNEVAKQVQAGVADDTPESLKKNPGLRAIYNQLVREREASIARRGERPPPTYLSVEVGSALDLAQRIDAAVKDRRPDSWRGSLPKEREIKNVIYEIVKDPELVDHLLAARVLMISRVKLGAISVEVV